MAHLEYVCSVLTPGHCSVLGPEILKWTELGKFRCSEPEHLGCSWWCSHGVPRSVAPQGHHKDISRTSQGHCKHQEHCNVFVMSLRCHRPRDTMGTPPGTSQMFWFGTLELSEFRTFQIFPKKVSRMFLIGTFRMCLQCTDPRALQCSDPRHHPLPPVTFVLPTPTKYHKFNIPAPIIKIERNVVI